MKTLLSFNASPYIQNDVGEIPLNIAMALQHKLAAQLLLYNMRVFDNITLAKSENLIHYSAKYNFRNVLERTYQRHRHLINEKTRQEQYTPLHISVLEKNYEITEMLLSLRARELQDYEGNFQIHYIKDEETLRIFMKTNQNFELQNREGQTIKDILQFKNPYLYSILMMNEHSLLDQSSSTICRRVRPIATIRPTNRIPPPYTNRRQRVLPIAADPDIPDV